MRVFGSCEFRESDEAADYSNVNAGAGAMVAGLGAGALPAVPVAMGLRALMDKYRSQAMTGLRIERRIKRLRALREQPLGEASVWEALPHGNESAV